MTHDKYYFFGSGFCSQWFNSSFTHDNITFNTAEQYMMYHKAKTFGDDEIADKILNTISPREQKALGRRVKNFNSDVWNNVAKDVVYKGNYLKFTQNQNILALLLNIDQIIVEASPYDTIWGIGLYENDPRCLDESKWRGTNWLGEVLTKLRDDLRLGYNP